MGFSSGRNTALAQCNSYDKALSFYQGRRIKSNKWRTITTNYDVRLADGKNPENGVQVWMHSTPIVTFYPDDSRTIRCGGWEESVTTRAKIAEVGAVRLFSYPAANRHRIADTTRVHVGNFGHYEGHQYSNGIPYSDDLKFDANGALLPGQGPFMDIYTSADPEGRKRVLAAKRVLWKRLEAFFTFHVPFDELRDYTLPYGGNPLRDYIDDLLENPPEDTELHTVAMTLAFAGAPDTYRSPWALAPELTPQLAKQWANRAWTKAAGKSGFDLYGSITETVPSWEV